MRVSIFILLIAVLTLTNCSTSEKNMMEKMDTFPIEGINSIFNNTLPFDSTLTHSVAKVFEGNNFAGTGAFISNKGLFITNYSLALSYFATNFSDPAFSFENNFNAQNMDNEIPIPGLSFWIEVEQVDVSSYFESQIDTNASNFEIFQIKQRIGQELITQKKDENPDFEVIINDIYSGNQQVLSVYQVLRDVRLVATPKVSVLDSDIKNSDSVYKHVSESIALFRAYHQDENGQSVPFEPLNYIQINPNASTKSESLFAFGFPNRTHRLESELALEFYNSETNPYILDAYTSHLAKETKLAEQYEEYSIASLASRFTTALQVDQYTIIQDSFTDYDIINRKMEIESDFRSWLADTTLPYNYQTIYKYLNQAFDIANQNGAAFYATSYIHSLTIFDDIGLIFKNYSESEEPQDLNQSIQLQYQYLSNINLDAELELFTDFILLLTKLPEEQKFLSIQDVIGNESEENYETILRDFMTRMKSSSFILNPEITEQTLLSGEVYSDSLFLILDESLFLNEMSRNNQGIYAAYLQPARQVLVDAKLDFFGQENLLPDANGTISFNKGKFDRYSSDNKFMFTINDFSGRAPGSIIINNKGELLGLIPNKAADNLSSNYLFDPNMAYLKSLSLQNLLSQINSIPNNESLLEEIGDLN